ncbi:Hypothetical protein NGAL_HAMBI1146_29000 [Neorhizobium galegae bv. officinalis]|nr:Hypothetical protein NGAL_HAMBI1146_29000 [Neorhizobium galegae bv. officinalis]
MVVRPCTPVRGGASFNNTAVPHGDNPIGDMEISIVMADDDEGLALSFHLRQQLFVKDAAEFRILICGPFIRHDNRAIFQPGLYQSKAFALPGGEVRCCERIAVNFHLMANAESFQMPHLGLSHLDIGSLSPTTIIRIQMASRNAFPCVNAAASIIPPAYS